MNGYYLTPVSESDTSARNEETRCAHPDLFASEVVRQAATWYRQAATVAGGFPHYARIADMLDQEADKLGTCARAA